MRRIGQYLSVNRLERPNGRKTDRWEVLTNAGELLGGIQWFGRWRQYTFDPAPGTTFNRDCLLDIATFLHDTNNRHRALRAKERDEDAKAHLDH